MAKTERLELKKSNGEVFATVDAEIIGHFGIHEAPAESPNRFSTKKAKKPVVSYRITHVPTGCQIIDGKKPHLRSLIAKFNEIPGIEWNFSLAVVDEELSKIAVAAMLEPLNKFRSDPTVFVPVKEPKPVKAVKHDETNTCPVAQGYSTKGCEIVATALYADVCGELAVYKSFWGQKYVLSHVPTGCSVIRGEAKTDLLKLRAALLDVADWSFKDPNDSKNILPVVKPIIDEFTKAPGLFGRKKPEPSIETVSATADDAKAA